MDKRFLDKVVGQIVSETEIYHDREKIHFPFFSDTSSFGFFSGYILVSVLTPSSLTKHCRSIYGLNKEETEYVWDVYKHIIKDKIENNG